MRVFRGLLAVALIVAITAASASAATLTLSNGLAGTDQYSVLIDENALSTTALIQAPGQGVENLMYEYYPILDFGGSVEFLSGGTWADGDPSDGMITSTGALPNGINWTVTHSLLAGEFIMTSAYTFSSPTGALLPAFRFFQYLDEDVYSISNNILVASGSIAGGDLELLTVHPDIKAGVSQAGDAQATGWGADEYWDLQDDLESGGYDAAPGGTLGSLPAIVDPFFGPAWGPRDITTVIEWEFPGGQQSVVSLEAYLGGVPEAGSVVPEPSTLALLGLGLVGLGVAARRRLRK